ncbi:MAG: hypothetical protein KGL63_06650 [Betaproteobacteria bacterium]|nr:hypothetical protein [Betaproteobacteria bacterium]
MLTAQQLVTYALQIVKANNYTTQAGDLLNGRLSSLARQFDFDVLNTSTQISVTSGTQKYTLPADYNRGAQFYYYIGGLPEGLDQMSLEDYNLLNVGSLAMAYPTNWASDPSTSPTTLYLYPMPNTSFPLYLQYFKQPADITNPSTSSAVPWLPDSDYLLTQLTADMMMLTDDARLGEFQARADMLLQRFLKMQGDKEGYAQHVKKGAGFRNQRTKLPPSKITGF